MNGQWIGKFTGDNNGDAVINIDDKGDHYEGVAYMIESSGNLPASHARFKTIDKGETFKINKLPVFPINPEIQGPDSWNNVKKFYGENVQFSKYADIEVEYNNEHLNLKWESEIGHKCSCQLTRSRANEPSEYAPFPQIDNWDAYKRYVLTLKQRNFIFRGQKEPKRLRTKFHRAGRSDIERFINEDRLILYKHLSARTQHLFNLNIPDENGAFFNLLQHHGYPTPLLDWTYSPYVAAFFAYRDISNLEASQAKDSDRVRIFIFDKENWEKDVRQSLFLTAPFLHLSIMDFIAINNERMVPQQAVSTVANVDDIESYIQSRETTDKKYLSVVDLPVKNRKSVMRELSYMGITAGSLFPGLDGACEELKERFFDI